MIVLLAMAWRGDEYDLSTWQGWVMLAVGLLAWTAVSTLSREAGNRKKPEKTDAGDRP